MKNVHSFPNLPVPDLNETMVKFLDWVEPLISKKELEIARFEVNNFLNSSDSLKLQKILIKKSKKNGIDSNWMVDWWIKYTYLATRGANALDCNAAIALHLEEKKKLPSHFILAGIVHQAATMYLDYKLNGDPIIAYGKVPMSLDQFSGTFAAMRLPNKKYDEYYMNLKISDNVIFMKGNITYNIPVIKNKKVLPLSQIAKNIEFILKKEKEEKAIGINFITAHTNHDLAKDLWDEIENLGNNKQKIKLVKDAIVAINYDNVVVKSTEEKMMNLFCGPNYNRWHGKGMNFALTKNKKLGVVSDHTYQDGATGITIVLQIMKYIESIENVKYDGNDSINYEKIVFESNLKIDKKLLEVEKKYIEKFNSAFVEVWKTKKINRKWLKEKGIVSVDAFVQLLFQLAQYYANKKLQNTYIAVDLRNFYKGRTECIRPISKVSKEFVRKWYHEDLKNNPNEIRSILKEIMDIHYYRLKECQKGKGINRHMFGLYLAYMENKNQFKSMPKLFETKAWKIISSNPISTTSLVHSIIDNAFFYPVHPKGIGIYYSVDETEFKISLTSWSNQKSHHKKILDGLKKASNDIVKILNK